MTQHIRRISEPSALEGRYSTRALLSDGPAGSRVQLRDPDTSDLLVEDVPFTAEEIAAAEAAEAALEPTFEDRRADKIAAIEARKSAVLAQGAPFAGKRIAVDPGSRSDLGGMGATALAVLVTSGSVPWPESYAEGWIAEDNTRVPLETPAAGLALGAAVGDWYAQVVQLARDLKNAALAAGDDAALEAIDVEGAGWPA